MWHLFSWRVSYSGPFLTRRERPKEPKALEPCFLHLGKPHHLIMSSKNSGQKSQALWFGQLLVGILLLAPSSILTDNKEVSYPFPVPPSILWSFHCSVLTNERGRGTLSLHPKVCWVLCKSKELYDTNLAGLASANLKYMRSTDTGGLPSQPYYKRLSDKAHVHKCWL